MLDIGEVGGENVSRSPCGERGLKFSDTPEKTALNASLPVRGAWVEITPSSTLRAVAAVAPRAGSVG